jgi:hypothetical protein
MCLSLLAQSLLLFLFRHMRLSVWEPGHWVERPNGWLWVAGQWRMNGG